VPFVVDASVTLSWCFEDEAAGYAERALEALADDVALVAGVWPYEVANGLVVAERRGRILPAQTMRFLTLLSALPIEIDVADMPAGLASLVPIARDHGLSAHDAAYLEVAARRGLPMVTLDEQLRLAARRAGVPVRE
jgi:predicted nucleic acid-binding protein